MTEKIEEKLDAIIALLKIVISELESISARQV
jgi:hypothetical protein